MLAKFMRALVAVAVASVVSVLLVAAPQPAEALSGSQFDPGYIISDAKFYDGNAMSEAEIQSFLTASSGTCLNSNCLAVHRISTTTTSAGFGTCATYQGAPDESAARIIFKVQQACGISAKVLLVTLQKEQGLVTKSAPTSLELRKAMGQGCPDTSDCDANYYGLQKQLYFGSRQLTWYGNPAGSFTYIKVGQSNRIQYHPNIGCGTGPVTVKNRATAALYYYTPYQPNAASLGNLYGTGDGCSSYGNRNFWVHYNNWFGSPNSEGGPTANLEVFAAVPGGVRVAGWAFDRDTAASIQVHIYVNGVGTAITASGDRPDIGATWPEVGSAHGFDVTLPAVGSGPQQVCVYGINVGPGQNSQIHCGTLPAATGSATGVLDVVQGAAGAITVAGWAFDPDTAASVPVHVYVDAQGYAFTADKDRPDVGAVYPQYGPKHGYSEVVPASPGAHRVCVYGIDIAGQGSNRQLGCATVTVPTGSPYGVLDGVRVTPGNISASGWVFDPDSKLSSPVHVYIGQTGVAAIADSSRPDVGRAYPGYGDLHGYTVTIPATPGVHNVCAYGIDIVPTGGNRQLGCRQVTALSGPPVGVVDAVSASGGNITAAGWAFDPDTEAPMPVHIYVDSVATVVTASNSRPDVGAVYPAFGPNHGYSATIPAAAGQHNVCIYAINTGHGSDVFLGCRIVNS